MSDTVFLAAGNGTKERKTQLFSMYKRNIRRQTWQQIELTRLDLIENTKETSRNTACVPPGMQI
jgi:hypothetical protein